MDKSIPVNIKIKFLCLIFFKSSHSVKKYFLLEKTAHENGELSSGGELKRMSPSFVKFTKDEKSLNLISSTLEFFLSDPANKAIFLLSNIKIFSNIIVCSSSEPLTRILGLISTDRRPAVFLF